MFVLAQIYRWNLHGTSVSLLSPIRNSAAGNTLLTANGIAQMLAVQFIAKRQANTKKYLGLYD